MPLNSLMTPVLQVFFQLLTESSSSWKAKIQMHVNVLLKHWVKLDHAALHALGNIAGETRVGSNIVLNDTADDNLKCLVYGKTSNTAKLTPSGLLLSILQQDSEIRTAGYRLITGLVARPWCLVEHISRSKIISILSNTCTETKKIGMESRYRCCEAIYRAFVSSGKLSSDPAFADIAGKFDIMLSPWRYISMFIIAVPLHIMARKCRFNMHDLPAFNLKLCSSINVYAMRCSWTIISNGINSENEATTAQNSQT